MTTVHLTGLIIAIVSLVLAVVLIRGADNLQRMIDEEKREQEER